MKKFAMCLMIVSMCCGLILFGGRASMGASTNKPIYLTIGGAGSGGRWYAAGSAVAAQLNKKLSVSHNVRASGVVTPGVSLGNIERINSEEITMGCVYGFDGYNAYYGKSPFQEKQKILAWFNIDSQFFRVYVDKSIPSWGALKGKNIAIGVPGSSDNQIAKVILELHGINLKDVVFREVGRESSVDAMIDRQADAWISVLSRDSGHASRLVASRKDIRQLPISDEVREKILADYPYLTIDNIGDTLLKEGKVQSIGIPSFIAVSPDLKEDIVYETTKVVFENIDDLYKSLPWWTKQLEGLDVTLERGCKVPIPLHPGAEKYFKEKGVL